jgi:hypothetical protein
MLSIPLSNTANNELRGLIAWYCIVEGVKCATLNLRGWCVPNHIVTGAIWTSFDSMVGEVFPQQET